MRRLKEKEKGKAKALEKVKKERGCTYSYICSEATFSLHLFAFLISVTLDCCHFMSAYTPPPSNSTWLELLWLNGHLAIRCCSSIPVASLLARLTTPLHLLHSPNYYCILLVLCQLNSATTLLSAFKLALLPLLARIWSYSYAQSPLSRMATMLRSRLHRLNPYLRDPAFLPHHLYQ